MEQARATVSARDRRLAVLDAEARRDLADRRALNESLRRSLAELQVQRERVTVQVKRLEFERARYTVRAPIDGLLGQVRAPQVGSVVAAGQTVAVVTPETALELVAQFAPATAIGRILARTARAHEGHRVSMDAVRHAGRHRHGGVQRAAGGADPGQAGAR